MIRRLTWIVAVAVLASPAAWAQDTRVELSGTAGWTFSDGVTRGAFRARDFDAHRPQGRVLVGRSHRLHRDPERRDRRASSTSSRRT